LLLEGSKLVGLHSEIGCHIRNLDEQRNLLLQIIQMLLDGGNDGTKVNCPSELLEGVGFPGVAP
jgi:hypothetical protein